MADQAQRRAGVVAPRQAFGLDGVKPREHQCGGVAPAGVGAGGELDIEEIEAAIVNALMQRTVLPPYEELRDLHKALLGHIQTLMPLAERQVDRLNRGTVAWYTKRSRLNTIPHEVTQGLGSGLQSADWHVRSLGYTCQFLLDNSGLAHGRDR
ncbi:DUF6415 family natural product biosynthesis protein [Streptomyces hygroscopicus]|uniref:DUF6415 family natural product biosynthesis protein n=1 Tax=Streptomyces hygroscopicus TaxID=1912 RepID=UPI0024A2F79D|nr:DUF6415 family natural product biosynthesis protein [Streptomyces hygroscopicus]GLV72404.1 hypothetical protein Shyhy02_04070 [Streptomyces hygroscopicus subsp. hygroscopicus]